MTGINSLELFGNHFCEDGRHSIMKLCQASQVVYFNWPAKRQKPKSCETKARLYCFPPSAPCWGIGLETKRISRCNYCLHVGCSFPCHFVNFLPSQASGSKELWVYRFWRQLSIIVTVAGAVFSDKSQRCVSQPSLPLCPRFLKV